MAKYLFSYDARDAGASVHNNIRKILVEHYRNVDRPVESTYIFERDECPIDDLCREVEYLLRDSIWLLSQPAWSRMPILKVRRIYDVRTED